MKPIRFLLITILLLLLTSCSPRHYSESFQDLQGYFRRSIPASAGQTLHVEYKAVVNKGSLELKVISPEKIVLWTVVGNTNGSVSKDIPTTEKGDYWIRVGATAAYGSYDLQYSVK